MSEKQSLIVNLGDQPVCLDLEEKIGQGAFGTVYKAVDNRGLSFAVKLIVCQDEEAYSSVAQEINFLLQLEHPNIVVMYGFELINFSAILIMEYCCRGTLNTRLNLPVSIPVQLQWMAQLTEALTYLHNSNIVHRDLKTENILLSDDSDVKIADFGIAHSFLCHKHGGSAQQLNAKTQFLDVFMGTFAGTPFWIAPEVFNNYYTEKADIFSLGVIFYAICEQQCITFQGVEYYGVFVDYKGLDTGIGLVMYEQQEHIKPSFKKTDSKLLKALILSMLHLDPDKRSSLTSIEDHVNNAFIQTLEIDDAEEDGCLAVAAGTDSKTVFDVGDIKILYGRDAVRRAREKIRKQAVADDQPKKISQRYTKQQDSLNERTNSDVKTKKNVSKQKIVKVTQEKSQVKEASNTGNYHKGNKGKNYNNELRIFDKERPRTFKASRKKNSDENDDCIESLQKLQINSSQPNYRRPTTASISKSVRNKNDHSNKPWKL